MAQGTHGVKGAVPQTGTGKANAAACCVIGPRVSLMGKAHCLQRLENLCGRTKTGLIHANIGLRKFALPTSLDHLRTLALGVPTRGYGGRNFDFESTTAVGNNSMFVVVVNLDAHVFGVVWLARVMTNRAGGHGTNGA